MSVSSQRRVVILAGGVGKRLAPYTFVIPKPIVPIGTTPVLEIVLRQLRRDGFCHVTIALGHMSDIIRAVAGDGSKFDLDISYSVESQPLGTIGPLRLIDDITDDFLVMNADLLTNLNFSEFWNYHVEQRAIATVATCVKTTKLELGVLQTDPAHRLVAFEEKPTIRHQVSMGIYAFKRAVLEYIPPDTYFGFDSLMRTLLERQQPIQSYPFSGRWLDIGVPADYEKAQEEFETHRDEYLDRRPELA